jgi:hypothetical protein
MNDEETNMHVLAVGGRGWDYTGWGHVCLVLNALQKAHPEGLTLEHGAYGQDGDEDSVYGGSKGFDGLVDDWAAASHVDAYRSPPRWKALGYEAFDIWITNTLLGNPPDMVLVFPGGKRTSEIERRARKLGIPVKRCCGTDHKENEGEEK